MERQECDCCGATAPSFGPIAAGNWLTGKGADGWTVLQFTIYREARAPDYIRPQPNQAFYNQVSSKVHVCAGCIGEVLKVFPALEGKISFSVPEQGDYVTMPKAVFDQMQAGLKKAGEGA